MLGPNPLAPSLFVALPAIADSYAFHLGCFADCSFPPFRRPSSSSVSRTSISAASATATPQPYRPSAPSMIRLLFFMLHGSYSSLSAYLATPFVSIPGRLTFLTVSLTTYLIKKFVQNITSLLQLINTSSSRIN